MFPDVYTFTYKFSKSSAFFKCRDCISLKKGLYYSCRSYTAAKPTGVTHERKTTQ